MVASYVQDENWVEWSGYDDLLAAFQIAQLRPAAPRTLPRVVDWVAADRSRNGATTGM